MRDSEFEIAIFSCNRSVYLLNCVQSILTNAQHLKISIIDDNSSKPEMLVALSILEEIPEIQIYKDLPVDLSVTKGSCAKTGNLHSNINYYLRHIASSNYSFLIQDDMQFVRELTLLDKIFIRSFFAQNLNSAFMYPGFLKRRKDLIHIDIDSLLAGDKTYKFKYDYEYSGYWDVCIADIEKIRRSSWNLQDEYSGSQNALSIFGRMCCMKHPLVAHLPFPRTHRPKHKTIALMLWNWLYTGFYPISPLTESDLRLLDASFLPVTAEEILKSKYVRKGHNWEYTSFGFGYPFLRFLSNLELTLQSIGKKVFHLICHACK